MLNTTPYFLPMAPDFPLEVLEGTVTADMLNVTKARTQADPGMIFTCILANIAAAVQELVDVETFAGQIKPTSLFSLVVAETNERKSAVDSLVSTAAREFEARVNQTLKTQERAEDEESDHEDEEEEKESKRHRRRRRWQFDFIYGDTTTPGMEEGMASSSRAAFHISDDASGIFKHVDLVKYCSMYSGGHVKIHRKNKPTLHLADPRLTVLWQIQPSLFDDYVRRKGQQIRDSGYIGRFLIVIPQSTQGTRTGRPLDTPPGQTPQEREFHKKMRELLDAWPTFNPKKPPNEAQHPRQLMTLTDEAKEEAWKFNLWAEQQLLVGSQYHDIRNFVGKSAENVCRVAAVLCFYETRQLVIDALWIKVAIHVVLYYLAHAKSVFGAPSPHERLEQDAERLRIWIVNRITMTGMDVPMGDIQRLAPADLRKSDRLTPVLTYLLSKRQLQRIHRGRSVSFGLPPANWELMQRALLSPNPSGLFTRI